LAVYFLQDVSDVCFQVKSASHKEKNLLLSQSLCGVEVERLFLVDLEPTNNQTVRAGRATLAGRLIH
jgi:hypothetical protein